MASVDHNKNLGETAGTGLPREDLGSRDELKQYPLVKVTKPVSSKKVLFFT